MTCSHCKKDIKGKMIFEMLSNLQLSLGFVGGSFHPVCFRKHHVKKAVDAGYDDEQAEILANEEMENVNCRTRKMTGVK